MCTGGLRRCAGQLARNGGGLGRTRVGVRAKLSMAPGNSADEAILRENGFPLLLFLAFVDCQHDAQLADFRAEPDDQAGQELLEDEQNVFGPWSIDGRAEPFLGFVEVYCDLLSSHVAKLRG